MARLPGLFDLDDRLRRLSDIGDQLEAFSRVVNFEMFRPELDTALNYSDGAKGGRPPFDPVMMFMCGRSLHCKRFLTAAVGTVHSCVRPVIAAHDRWP